jgi:hypothetical protein
MVDAICITTNGFTKSNGRCVMGRGCAKEALNRYPGIDLFMGKMIKERGNYPFMLVQDRGTVICSFPVKPVSIINNGNNVVSHMKSKFNIGDAVPGWAAIADLNTIEQSAWALTNLTTVMQWGKVALPRPGCGAGELRWGIVKPILDKYLDDRFISVTF